LSSESKDEVKATGAFPVADRLIFLIYLVLITIPLLFPLGLPIAIAPATNESYFAIEGLAEGSVVLFEQDNSFGTWAELAPPDIAMTRHLFKMMEENKIRLIFYSGSVQGNQLSQRVIKDYVGRPYPFNNDPDYGKYWVHLGWIPGGEPILAGMVSNMVNIAPIDLYNIPTESMEIFQYISSKALPNDIITGDDINLFLVTHCTSPDSWARQWGGYGDPQRGFEHGNMIHIFSAGSVPYAMPFIGKGQMRSYLGGQRAGAEYELLINKPGLGAAYMDAQDFAHLFGIVLIVGSNIFYLYEKQKVTKK